ncbi:MAG: N-acetylglucosamine-6-phosphate deacetylase [Dehalococcoidia bacterium]|nr:N-acetylglucosamine-6-phosphate deacetylase [Dehalococcoidia bacterium]
MSRRLFVGGRLLLPEGIAAGAMLCRDGRIEGLLAGGAALPSDAERIDLRGHLLVPGLTDIHVHGGGGHSLMTDDPAEVRAYARWAVGHGVTSFLISTAGRDHAEIVRRLRALASAVGCEPGAARVLGFHLEGPYINPVRKGAFDARWLRPPGADEYRELFEASGGHVRQITLAPELPGADELIAAVVASDATAAMGHTDATYEQARRAIDLGVTHVTHCFNAMRPFSHRDPGVLGAVLESDAVSAELIGDGAHVAYPAARVLLRAKGAGRVVLVSDGMPLAGTADGAAVWEGQRIRVARGAAMRDDGTIVGGVTTLDQMVRNVVEHLRAPSEDALRMASANAAAAVHLPSEYGRLAVGSVADFIVLDDALRAVETWVAGERVWESGGGGVTYAPPPAELRLPEGTPGEAAR